jgi:hypothetical protein
VEIVKSAIETTTKICFTLGAGVSAADPVFKNNLFSAGVTEIHRFSLTLRDLRPPPLDPISRTDKEQ